MHHSSLLWILTMTAREHLWPHVSVKSPVFPDTVAAFYLLSQLIFHVKLSFNCSLKGLNLNVSIPNHPDGVGSHEILKIIKCTLGGNLWPWEEQKEMKAGLPLGKEFDACSDSRSEPPQRDSFLLWQASLEDFTASSIYGLFLKSKPSEPCLPTGWLRFIAKSSAVKRAATRGSDDPFRPLLPDLLHLSLEPRWGFDKVLGDHLVLAQPPDAALDRSEDLLQPAVQR